MSAAYSMDFRRAVAAHVGSGTSCSEADILHLYSPEECLNYFNSAGDGAD
ncbi:MAG: hypothetical protein AAGJ84_01705 [Pseudomonadota bacterium]